MLIGLVSALVVLWLTKKNLTHAGLISVCAVSAYLFAYLEGVGGNAHGQQLIDFVAVQGTISFVVILLVSWLIFRKRIKARELARDDADRDADDDEPT